MSVNSTDKRRANTSVYCPILNAREAFKDAVPLRCFDASLKIQAAINVSYLLLQLK